MSKQLISQYYSKVDKLIQFGGSRNEENIKSEFAFLLNQYAERKNLLLVRELPVKGTKGKNVTPDGVLKNILRLDYGLWESKDEYDDLQKEIDAKQRKGYPFYNILFEDGQNAILFQSGEEVMRIDMRKPDELDRILNAFITFRKPEVARFEEALRQFKNDIPTILETLRENTDEAGKKNLKFIRARDVFLELCKAEINPDITAEDIREMIIQHILTSDIFNVIFDDAEFFQHNNIAAELEKLISTFFTVDIKRNTLDHIRHYYQTINATAASLVDHHEKQKFLKALYEDFYKAYNPKAADRLGVVYTPNEIVDFMIDSTNYLLEKHFGRLLWDKNVEILDPATGTGTFICNMIDKCPNQYLSYKYKNELHANEVAILPYYISNLNIEYTYKQKIGSYAEFPGVCFVDTLDNTEPLVYGGKQHGLFRLSSENTKRIEDQNKRKISVIIGNPPYNANQKNENENNKNREYLIIDKRIKETYIKNSTAQKTKVYDMYARFYRWSMDRVDKNGMIAFITNRSFINSRTFDGFRKTVEDDFEFAYIIDTKSDVRANPKIAGTTHNVFGIQTGIAIMFLVKREKQKSPCSIQYISMLDEWRKEEKWQWFHDNRFEKIEFEKISPDKNHNWINIKESDWEEFIPIASKETKTSKKIPDEKAIFKLFSLGAVTNRDEWVYDVSRQALETKINFFIETYEKERVRWHNSDKKIAINDFVNREIKWTSELESYLKRGIELKFNKNRIRISHYRPFFKTCTYFDKVITHRPYQNFDTWGLEESLANLALTITGHSQTIPLFFCSNILVDQGFGSRATSVLPLYRYDASGNRIENITDWGVEQFVNHYGYPVRRGGSGSRAKKEVPKQVLHDNSISKQDIFHYCYSVLHNPAYRKKYEQNLKREFPRIPFYDDFFKWAKWGRQLMDLHINYETVEPYSLKQITSPTKAEHKRVTKELFQKSEEPEALYARKPRIKAKLKADKQNGSIEIDELTTLTGIPKEAWQYKLGNRSALEWILDQYKEKKPKDPTIAEKFNTYRFADYKEKVIDLIKRVTTVSVETVKIVDQMGKEN